MDGDTESIGGAGIHPRTADAMIERLVRAETRIETLINDAQVIRTGMHEIRGQLQTVLGIEHLCQKSLEGIDKTLAEWKPIIQGLIIDQGRRAGVTTTWAHIGVLATIGITCAGTIIALLALLLHKG